MTSLLASLRRRLRRLPPPDPEFGTVPWDGVPWRFRAAARVVAVGDVQGDLVALDAVLHAAGLVDGAGCWRGGRQQLVLLGDLVGGHEDGRLVVEYAMRLEQQSRAAGGSVHALLGNHDLLPARGDVEKWTRKERRRYRRQPVPGAPGPRARDAFRGDSALACWLRQRNAVVVIDDTLFAHAGVDEWFARTSPGDVNATVRAWIAHWQGKGAEPPPSTRWAVGVPGMTRQSRLARGPLWTRGFKPDGVRRPEGGPARSDLARWLEAAGVRRLVVGHAPVADDGVQLEHPYYGGLVVMADTRLSDRRHGSLSALAITAQGLEALQFADRHRDAASRRREQPARAAPTPRAAASRPRIWWPATSWYRAWRFLLRLLRLGR